MATPSWRAAVILGSSQGTMEEYHCHTCGKDCEVIVKLGYDPPRRCPHEKSDDYEVSELSESA